nr:MAG TPA: hypothetical protein [Inoviridae sp.]
MSSFIIQHHVFLKWQQFYMFWTMRRKALHFYC